MSATSLPILAPTHVGLDELGRLEPVSRPGGQGRVYRPVPAAGHSIRRGIVVKLYRRTPPAGAVEALDAMIGWSRSLPTEEARRLHDGAAWPLAVVAAHGVPTGIVMRDLHARFAVPFTMPSGRRDTVLLALEHLLGQDGYLLSRGLDVTLDTVMRMRVAERISGALGFLHRHGIAASDIAPSNLLVGFGNQGPSVCFIDCDSMVFRGRQALAVVETGDWQIPPEFHESPLTRSADAYKLGLVVLRLLARSHDARSLGPHRGRVPVELHGLLERALAPRAANRPPAGEWQRTLRQTLLAGQLARRYPRPARVTRPAPPTAAASKPEAIAAVRPLRTRPTTARSSTSPGPQLLGALAWIAIGIVLFTLVLSRLLASAVPSYGTSGFTPGGSGGGISQSPYPGYGAGPGDANQFP